MVECGSAGGKFPNWNPYAYCYQNPINVIDPTGMAGEGVDNEYNFNLSTGKTTYVSNKRGNKTDHINVIVGGKKQYTDVVEVQHNTIYNQTYSEIGSTFYNRKPGESITIVNKPISGALQDPSADIHVMSRTMDVTKSFT